ncbi:MAG: FAD-linked oxidase C-terminal domain-containing protein [Tepidisphaeraceae bacterium]
MPSLTVLPGTTASSKIEQDLRRLIRGQVRFGEHDKALYATDASIYQVMPRGVICPADAVDVRNFLNYCHDHRVPVLPRGGGTSLAGQGVNDAVVCDLSQMCRGVIGYDEEADTLHVEAGISIEEVNRWLIANGHRKLFAPDPATIGQCAIGGAIGNNAAGARSIRYGRTSENIAAIELVLPGGDVAWIGPGAGRRDAVALRLARHVASIARQYATLIRERFPRLNRRNAGYGIDTVLHQLDAGVAIEDLDLIGLVCGSEGTLGIVTSAKLKLHPIARAKGLAVLSFATVEDAIDQVQAILTTGSVAVELLDDEVLTAASNNFEASKNLDVVAQVDGRLPKAVLYVEYQSETDADAVSEGFAKLKSLQLNAAANYFTDAPMQAKAWALRKAGEPLLHGLSATRKPLTFVEDNSIPITQLPRFVREFRAIVAKHGTRAAYYAHAGVGVLHVRPMIDLHDPADRKRMLGIAQEVADLARDCGGVMSGEHGDGRARGPLLERFFGPELMQCFRLIKSAFDPHGILNPDMIVRPGDVNSIATNLRVDAGQVKEIDTYFDYSDQEGFHGAVEMCNGAGFCRKTAGGTMCPSYRATLDERHSTRGRGNALRLAISGQLHRDESGRPDFADAGTIETLDLCLSCKACKSECPSNVDIARLKAEYHAQKHAWHGTSFYARFFGHVRKLNEWGSKFPSISNALAESPSLRAVANKILGLAPQRTLPKFARSLYADFRRHGGSRGSTASAVASISPKVVLYGDCFTTFNDTHIGHAAIDVLEKLGYEVLFPQVGCCGRAMISTGLLPDAIKSADATLKQLKPFINDPNVRAILVAEPSCLASFKDDWLQLKLQTPKALRQKLAAKSFLVEEFVERDWQKHPTPPTLARRHGPPVILHGHCHQKALWGDETSGRILQRLFGERLQKLPSGCCGMAGSFGYAAHRYDVSMKIGELSVFPPVREAPADAVIVAPGTSCRHQIHDGTGRHARHPIEVIRDVLRGDPV